MGVNPAVAALATWRLAKLITEDEITRPYRIAIGRWAQGEREFSLKERVESAVNCTACMSVWSAGAVLVASRFRLGRWLVGILAASGAALAVEAAVQRLER